MNILFERKFLKDVECISEKSVRQHIENIISEIEIAQQLNELPHLKKIKGHGSAYRIRIGNYRLGFFYENHTAIFSRVLHRKDIYKHFP
jgi:mRNA interferase RelE/StbE